MSKTRDSLGIFWEGDEEDGLRVYGFWPREVAVPPEFPADLWPRDVTLRPWKLWGVGWTVWCWDMRLRSWPMASEWVKVVSRTLEAVRAAGAIVAWCGIEGCFADPPSLFDRAVMGGGVWACFTRGGVSHLPAALDREIRYLPKSDFVRVHSEITVALKKAEGCTGA